MASSTGLPEAAGTISVTVALNSPSVQPISVDCAISGGTATVGDDVEAAAGTLTIPAGATETTFDLTIIDDTLVDADTDADADVDTDVDTDAVGVPPTGATVNASPSAMPSE